MLPAVRDAREVVSRSSVSPVAAIKLAVLVHQEHDLCVRLRKQTIEFLVDLLELLFVHYEIGTLHVRVSRDADTADFLNVVRY